MDESSTCVDALGESEQLVDPHEYAAVVQSMGDSVQRRKRKRRATAVDGSKIERKWMEQGYTYWVCPPGDRNNVAFHVDSTETAKHWNSVRYTHAILYFAWRHLYWMRVAGASATDAVVLPMHVLAARIIHNLESFSRWLSSPISSHVVVFETLVAMSRGPGSGIRFCAIQASLDSQDSASERALFGDGLGVYFDKDVGDKIHYGLRTRQADDLLSSMHAMHEACFSLMMDRQVVQLFKLDGHFTSTTGASIDKPNNASGDDAQTLSLVAEKK